MLVLAAGLSTPLAAQSALALGLAFTVGGGWQIQGADIGLARRLGFGPIRGATLAARFGEFSDQGAVIGGAQGFVAGAVFDLRTGAISVAEMGDEASPSYISLDLTFETAGYVASSSPLPQGGRWVSAAVLPELRFGSANGSHYSLLLGPAAFLGHTTDVRAFLGFRFEAPLARHGSRP